MEVIMTSPVQECLMMENGGGDDSAKLTKSKKRRQKKKKQAASVPTSGDANTGSKREDCMETSSNKMISDKIATPDAKIVAKGEEGTTATDNTVSKKRKRLRKKKNQSSNDMVTVEKDLSKTATDDVKMVSKGENHMETSSNKMISDKTATPDAKTVSKGEDETKVANGEMVSGTTPTDNTMPKKKKKKKNQEASNDMVTNGEMVSDTTGTDDVKMVSKGEEDTKVVNGEMGSGTTATDNTVSKKRKRPRKKKNQEASNDMVTVEKDLSKTATDDVKMVSKGEETGTDVVKMVSDTTATDNTVPKKKKSRKKKKKNQEASNDMVNVEKDSTKTETNDAKMVSKGENHTKVTNANKGLIKTTKSYKNGRVTEQKIHRSTERGQNKDKQEGKKHEVCYASMGAKRVKMESVIQTGKEKLSGTTKPGKKLLIFDINGLLADIVSPRPQDVQADYYIPKRAIFKRPYLDGFLRFCFERFNVGIWSSRTKQVLYPVVDFLLGDLKKNLLFIWDNSFCTNTGMKTLEDKYKPMVFKDLRKIWLKWLDGTFHESNTLLLDDSPYKALLNPKNTAIFPLSYSYKDRNDDFLGPNGDLRKYLEVLADTEDVKTYVEQHPFGQSAIDQTHPSWAFYAKALKSQK
ncbi:uncharacterized protein LOC111919483 isoform X1 [Lactuca sativa]|uniref:FCP1 homology domain-containing protein n=1 Tax=Lactuca sativa TaxID=4236 RepID=A0A9R1XH53_LACSA|nr:uncharacterized protein LOC111919483 isoform X1 [Lactuca sativa]KAJ0212514.1 hypothetical protein LSAT_V11C400222980 [Lactuca sativa]